MYRHSTTSPGTLTAETLTAGTMRNVQRALSVLCSLLWGVLWLGQELSAQDVSLNSYNHWATSLQFSSDGTRLYSAGGQSLQYRPGRVAQWDLSSGRQLHTFEGLESNAWCVALDPRGEALAACGYSGEIRIWEIASQKPLRTIEGLKGWVRCITYDPAGQHLAAGSHDGEVVIWETEKWTEVKRWRAHEHAITCLAYSPAGDRLATASGDSTVKLWDWNKQTELKKLEGHQEAVYCVAYSPDGEWLGTAGTDRRIMLWSPEGELRASWKAHRDWINALRFSPDNQILASCGHDRLVKLWKLSAVTANADKLKETDDRLAATEKEIRDGEQRQDELTTQIDALGKQVSALEALVAWKQAETQQAEAQAALQADAENQELAKKLDAAKKATAAAKKEADATAKAASGDQAFGAIVTALNGKASNEAQAKLTEYQGKLAQMRNELADSQEQRQQKLALVDQLKQAQNGLQLELGRVFAGHQASVWGLAFSPQGDRLASSSHRVGSEQQAASIRIWDVASGKVLFGHAESPQPDEVEK